MKPHKHAELIKAWADGAIIEWVYATKGDGEKLWVVVDNHAWNESHEYRIKPEPKPCNGFCGEQECKENQKNCERARMARKLLGSGTPQTELNAGGEPVKNATYWKRQHDKLADRIAEFEKLVSEMKYEKSSGVYEKQSEPVAIPFCWYCVWLGEKDEPVWEQYEECHPATKQWDNFPDKTIPLYTTPQTKPLSDEEIKEVIRKHWNRKYGNRDMLTLCKAVLEEANK